MTRTMPTAGKRPERTCIVTRMVRSPDQMIRFVVSPDGEAVPDLKRNLPGRGVWVTATAAIVREAAKRRVFERSFKQPVKVDSDLAARIDSLLERDALQSLSLANKAGAVVTGSAKVEAAIAERPLGALVHAHDGSADGSRKLGQALRRRYGDLADAVPQVSLFQSAQLDLALGRSNVIHAALAASPASQMFVARVRRLNSYRGGSFESCAAESLLAETSLAKSAAPAQETAPEPGSGRSTRPMR